MPPPQNELAEGAQEPGTVWLYTHQQFAFAYNDDQARRFLPPPDLWGAYPRPPPPGGCAISKRSTAQPALRWRRSQVIEVTLTNSAPVKLEPRDHMVVRFSYSISWATSQRSFESRFDRYLDPDFFEHKVRATCRARAWRMRVRR